MAKIHNFTIGFALAGLMIALAGCTQEATDTPASVVTLQESTPTIIPFTPTATATSTPTLAPTPTETSIPTEFVDERGIPLVYVPQGEFIMGSDYFAPNEAPAHKVTLDAYYMDKYEVTFASFAEFLNEKGNQIEGYANWVEASDPDLRIHEVDGVWVVDDGFDNYPMVESTWFGAVAYCDWRGARLPTEAEWEKAARGTDGRLYPWGNDPPDCDKANFGLCSHVADPVDSHPEGVSPYGVYNMSGNVMEWVADWYARTYYAESPVENPAGPEQTGFRLFRGGTFRNSENNVRTTYRFAKLPVLTYATAGFRCARDVNP